MKDDVYEEMGDGEKEMGRRACSMRGGKDRGKREIDINNSAHWFISVHKVVQ